MSRLLTTGVIAAARRRISDPLAGVSFALRLQTHRGDGIPLGLYQDTAGTIPATLDGDPVARWDDLLSGSGIIFSQSISTRRPTLKFVSGLPVVRFDGGDDFLGSLIDWSALGEILLVASCRINATNYCVFDAGIEGGNDSYWRYAGDGDGYLGLFRTVRAAGFPPAMPASDPHIISIESTPSNYQAWVDGVSKGTRTADFNVSGPYSYIGCNGAGLNMFQGDVSAILVTSDISARGTIESNILVTP